MGDQLLFELMQRQLALLKQFIKVLTEERDAIVSFSLEGITRANNVKEELLKKLEFLDDEQQRILAVEPFKPPQSTEWASMKHDLERSLNEVKRGLEKNMKLLSFSMDHVKGSIERIIGFINRASYGQGKSSISLMAARRV